MWTNTFVAVEYFRVITDKLTAAHPEGAFKSLRQSNGLIILEKVSLIRWCQIWSEFIMETKPNKANSTFSYL